MTILYIHQPPETPPPSRILPTAFREHPVKCCRRLSCHIASPTEASHQTHGKERHPVPQHAVSCTKGSAVKVCGRMLLKCDGTRAETRFRLLAKRTSPFKSAGSSVQSTAGSRGVRIGGSNAGYTMFRGSVKSTGYPLPSPVSPSLPLPCVTVCHHISTGLYSTPPGLCGSLVVTAFAKRHAI